AVGPLDSGLRHSDRAADRPQAALRRRLLHGRPHCDRRDRWAAPLPQFRRSVIRRALDHRRRNGTDDSTDRPHGPADAQTASAADFVLHLPDMPFRFHAADERRANRVPELPAAAAAKSLYLRADTRLAGPVPRPREMTRYNNTLIG